MSTRAVTDVLEDLAKAVSDLVAAAPDLMDDEPLEPSTAPLALTWPNPQRAVRRAQLRLRRCRAEVVREFAAWWADLASVALADTAERVPVRVVRAAAGDPSAELSDGDLRYLPGRTFRSEGPILVDQLVAEYRRDQLWGADWTNHRVPPLPEVTELRGWLIGSGIPEHGIADVCVAREAVAHAMETNRRSGVELDTEAAIDNYEELTGSLADYARLLTAALRMVWSGAR